MSQGRAGFDRRRHVPRRFDAQNMHALGRGKIDGTGNEHDFGPRCVSGARYGVALLAGGTVGDEADRVDRLMGRPGGDDHPLSGQNAVQAASTREKFLDGGKNFGGLGHASGAEFAAGHRAVDWGR